MRLNPAKHRHVTIISAQAPTMSYTDEDEDEALYAHLSQLLESIPSSDMVILLGDFNARFGRDTQAWRPVSGPHGVGKENSNGNLLLSF